MYDIAPAIVCYTCTADPFILYNGTLNIRLHKPTLILIHSVTEQAVFIPF